MMEPYSGEGEHASGYGGNTSYSSSDDSIQRFHIITALTKSPGKTRWALAMGFIKATKLTNTYVLTHEGINYWRSYDN